MATIEKNGAITIDGIDELNRKLEQMKTQGTGFEKRLREAIRKIMGEARANLQKDAASGLQMQSDPRHAYKAVRYAVHKRIFGGQVNILQSRRAGNRTSYEPERKIREGQRGGNRMMRSRRTENLMSYEGKDRGFILRFLNQGTTQRTSYGGNRGSIAARRWFGSASQRQLEASAAKLQQIIDKVINEEFK